MARLSRRRVARYAAEKLAAGSKTILKEVAAYLITEGRTNEVDLVAHDIEVALEHHGHVLGRVSVARELNSATQTVITQLIKKETGAHDIQLLIERDESLIAGIKLDLPNRQLDATVNRTVSQLTNAN